MKAYLIAMLIIFAVAFANAEKGTREATGGLLATRVLFALAMMAWTIYLLVRL